MARAQYNYKDLLGKDDKFKEFIDSLSMGSQVGADVTLRRIGNICRTYNLTTQAIGIMTAKEGHSLAIKIVKDLHSKGKAREYMKSYVTAVKAFFEHNEKPIEQKIRLPREDGIHKTKVQQEQVPTPEQLGRVLDHCNIEQKVRVALVALCGFRLETLGNFGGIDGIRVMDLPELKIKAKSKKAEFEKVPTRIICRPSLSKAKHQYFSFMPAQGCAYLQELLEQRMRLGEVLKPESFLVTSLKYSGKEETTSYKGGAISTTKISASIRKALRKAGLDVRPYVLRSYFETRLMMAEADKLLLRDYRVYLMGHRGDIEHRYSLNKEGLPEETIEQMRSMFAKASERYLVTTKSQVTDDKLKDAFNRQFLEISGMSEADIAKLGDLSRYSAEEMRAIVRDSAKKDLGIHNGNSQKVIAKTELKEHIAAGWEFVAFIDNNECIIKLPNSH